MQIADGTSHCLSGICMQKALLIGFIGSGVALLVNDLTPGTDENLGSAASEQVNGEGLRICSTFGFEPLPACGCSAKVRVMETFMVQCDFVSGFWL